jgi:enoyl-CoA hydratase/carnithine racemase
MSDSRVTMDYRDRIGIITIDNPPVNHLSKDVLSLLNKTVSDMMLTMPELRAVLLTSEGRNFSAGIDYPEFVRATKDEAGHLADVGYHLLRNIESLPVPVIAAVKGDTTGAGLGLALSADLRIAATDTVFSFPEAQYGVPPIFGSSQRLYKTVGIGRAKELLLTGRTVRAEEALNIGLINKIVPVDLLDEEANRLAAKISGNSLSSMRSIKMLVNFGLNEGYDVGLKEEITAFSEAFNPDTEQWERL